MLSFIGLIGSQFGALPFYFLVVGVVTWMGKEDLAKELVALCVINSLLVYGFKNYFQKPRPISAGYAFPSGHTSRSATLFGYLVLNGFNMILLGLPIIVGISRILVHAHDFSDVLGGILFGSLLAVGFKKASLTVVNRPKLMMITGVGGMLLAILGIKKIVPFGLVMGSLFMLMIGKPKKPKPLHIYLGASGFILCQIGILYFSSVVVQYILATLSSILLILPARRSFHVL